MTVHSWIISFVLLVAAQNGSAQGISAPGDWLTAAERARLAKEAKVENRIKVYQSASERYKHAVTDAAARQEFDKIPEQLGSWMKLLEQSGNDITSNIGRKKKSKALIRFEIQLRKAISDVQEAKLKAPVEQLEIFESWLGRAEEIRKTFVGILFQT